MKTLSYASVAALQMTVVSLAGTTFGEHSAGDERILFKEYLGVGEKSVYSNSYVFINGMYIEPPYVVQRIGQAVTVNGIIVNFPSQEDVLGAVTNEAAISSSQRKKLRELLSRAGWSEVRLAKLPSEDSPFITVLVV